MNSTEMIRHRQHNYRKNIYFLVCRLIPRVFWLGPRFFRLEISFLSRSIKLHTFCLVQRAFKQINFGITMKNLTSTLPTVAIFCLILCFVSTAEAQRQAGQRGPGDGPRGPQRGMNPDQQQGNRGPQQGNQAEGNQNGNRNMPTIQQLATMMITNFDADGSGELSQSELQNALTALREKMQNQGNQNQGNPNRGNGPNQAGQPQNGGANKQGRQNGQAARGQGNRPPHQGGKNGQGNAGRGR